jgi:hypothetical protein
MRPFVRLGAPGARKHSHRGPRTGLVFAVLIALSAPVLVAPARAAATQAGMTRIPTASGHSAAGGRTIVDEVRSSASPRAENALAPAAAVGPDPRIARGPAAQTVTPSTRAPSAPAQVNATITTTTTLEVSPANPLVFPAKLHVKATVTPAPQPFQGFTPGIGFYVDGTFRDSTVLMPDGTGELDMQPFAPGTYAVTAQFLGLGDYGASSSAPRSVTVVQKPGLAVEQGSPALQSSFGFEPERHTALVKATSPSIGVGPSDILSTNEGGVLFSNRAGIDLFHLSLTDFFFVEPPGQDNDAPRGAKIVFDQLHGRWIATEVTRDFGVGKGHVYVAFSGSSNATGEWWIYRFDFNNETPSNPSIGVSSDKIAVGYDVAAQDTQADLGSTVLVVDTAQLFAHPSIVNYNRSTPNPARHTWRPAFNRTAGFALRAVGWSSATDPGHLLAMTANGTVTGGGVSFVFTDLTSGPTALPDLGAGTPRGPSDAIWLNNRLWFVSTHSCFPPGDPFTETCVRVTELGTGVAFTAQQDFAIARNGYANFLGGIGIAADGSVFVTYAQTSSLPSPGPLPVSTWATVQAPGDPANSVRPSQLIAQGEPTCAGGPDCFGVDMGSLTQLPVVADPNDSHSVWQASMITVDGGWATETSRLSAASTAASGSFVLAGGRAVTNSLRLGIAPTPVATATATQLLISNSPATTAGTLSNGKAIPIDRRVAWSLADAAFGGSTATGIRSVYLQWGDGTGNWSPVQHHELTVGTPLGADFVPLAPTRLLDTRAGNGLSGAMVSRVPRSFQVAGRGGVPAGAVAVTGNLTMVGQTAGGFAFLGPTATASPTSSTLNAPKGDVRANGLTVKLGPGGKLGVVFASSVSTATANLIFDVTGYLLNDDPNAPKGSTYIPVAPVRALDTRLYNGEGRFYSHQAMTFCVTGCVPVPDDAVAVTGNLTVTGQSTAGYVFLGPTPVDNPRSSTLNFPLHDTRANNVTVGLDSNGNLSATFVGSTSSASTDLIFDITGYFVRGPWGATFVPLDPARILDTRSGIGLTGRFAMKVPRSFGVAGKAGVPGSGTMAVVGNLTVVGQSSAGYAFLGPTAPTNPTSSTLNIPFGDVRANGIDVGLSPNGTLGGVWVGATGSSTDMLFDVVGYFR